MNAPIFGPEPVKPTRSAVRTSDRRSRERNSCITNGCGEKLKDPMVEPGNG